MSKFGAACDNLLSATMVTVDWRLLKASPDSNEDLFGRCVVAAAISVS